MISVEGPNISMSGETTELLAEIAISMMVLSDNLARATGRPLNEAAEFVARKVTMAFAGAVKERMQEEKP